MDEDVMYSFCQASVYSYWLIIKLIVQYMVGIHILMLMNTPIHWLTMTNHQD